MSIDKSDHAARIRNAIRSACAALAALAFVAGWDSKPAQAQAQALFTPVPNNQLPDAAAAQAARLGELQSRPTTAALQLVRVNTSALEGTSALVALPGDGAVQIDRRRVNTRSPADYTWIGEPQPGGQAIFVVRDGQVIGHIQSGVDTYSVVALGGGIHAVIKVDQSRMPPDHPRVPPVAPQGGGGSPTRSPDSPAPTTLDSPNGVQVDILIAYTTAARTAYGGNMDAFAQLAVDTANAAYNASNANVTLRLVGTMEVAYSQASFDEALDYVTNGTGVLAAVHTKRDQVGADLVTLMINDPSSCGLAWINSTAAYAFSTVHWDCSVSNHSFAHEIGHNFGARHDPYVDPTTTPFAYGHGYTTPTWQWRTIMAYINECQSHGVNCPRLGYFSNPSNTYLGAPMGTSGTHDNARVHRERVATVAAFKAAVTTAAATHDFNGDAKSDILWRQSNSSVAMWLMNGVSVSQVSGVGGAVSTWQIVGQRDFDGDGKHDILWRNSSSGQVLLWLMNGATVTQSAGVGAATTDWQIVGTGDFNGDGKGDILWRNTGSGQVILWVMNGATVTQSAGVGAATTDWQVASVGDLNGDGKADILWRHSGGTVVAWLMNGASVTQTATVGGATTDWQIVGVGDFNGDSKADILWRHSSGAVAAWLMNGVSVAQSAGIGSATTDWTVAETGDLNGDGKSDIIWRHSGGSVAAWLMNGVTVTQSAGIGGATTDWVIQTVNAN